MQYDKDGKEIKDGLTMLPLDIDPHLKFLNMNAGNSTPQELRTSGAPRRKI